MEVQDLENINSEIKKIVKKIEKESGFKFLGNFFVKIDNLQNQNDPEFKTQDTYRVVMGESTFCPYTKEPFNDYFRYIKKVEEDFCLKYSEELSNLFNLLYKKETIENINNKKDVKQKVLKKF